LLSAACAIALVAVAWTSPAAAASSPNPKPAAARASERGVVQSVTETRLVLKALDGSIVTVAIDASTRVLVDGRPASILDVRPGFIAVVAMRGASGKPAVEVQAFSTASGPIAGVVRSVSATRVVLTERSGTRFTLDVETIARVFVDGKRASLAAVRAGFTAVVRPAAGDLRELYAFSPPRTTGARLYDGVVTAVGRNTIVVQARNAGKLRFALGTNTAVFVDGKPGSILDVETGDLVVFRTGPRRQVWAFSVR
jgi:hypothetical protein